MNVSHNLTGVYALCFLSFFKFQYCIILFDMIAFNLCMLAWESRLRHCVDLQNIPGNVSVSAFNMLSFYYFEFIIAFGLNHSITNVKTNVM